MNPRVRSLALTLVASAVGVGGWLATLWAASDRWAGIAFAAIELLLIAAAFRGRFAANERARDFWTGFALFGLIHLLANWPNGSVELMTRAAIDRVGDRLLGDVAPRGNRLQALTPLGHRLAAILVDRGGTPIRDHLPYIRETTKLFGGLGFAAIGGLAARQLRRRVIRSDAIPRPGGCPLSGIAWLYLLGVLIGATFAIHAHPEIIFDDEPWFGTCPGSEAALFALFNVELLAVLFAALEARFGAEGERPWWIGFALFGGAYLLAIGSSLAPILPTRWMGDLFQWVYFRFVSESQMPAVTMRGVIMFDYATGNFFRSGLTWAGLAALLPVAWLGTVAARLACRLGAASGRPGLLDRWRVRSSIGRIMFALVAIGLILAAAKHPSEGWVAAEGNAIAGLLLFAALRASFGPGSSRAWWWGFALVGGIDLLVGATRYYGWGQFFELRPSPWPLHEAAYRLHRLGFERYVGKSVPFTLMGFDVDDPMIAIKAGFTSSQALVLMATCLPMAWIGATLARWLDRQRALATPEGAPTRADPGGSVAHSGDFSEQNRAAGEYPDVHHEGGGIMRYALALVCPPLALLGCRRWFQAVLCAILYALAIATARYGIGALIDFFLILWSINVVSDEEAGRQARAFVKTVKPIPVIRS